MIPERDGTLIAMEIADGEDISEGQIVCVDANGKAVGVGSAAVRTVGIAYELDPDGDGVIVKRGVFLLANDTTSAVTDADLGAACYAKDSNTVQKAQPTEGFTGEVGKVLGVDDDGVWVEIR